ncbi:DNA adenine methylase [Agrobacterium sp. 22-221-1]
MKNELGTYHLLYGPIKPKTISPFLKWAGGKRWLAERHINLFPNFNGSYVEPFLGGASIFFKISPARALLSDLNPRLVECYNTIKSSYRDVEVLLEHHQARHDTKYYYEMRGANLSSSVERAAQFIYLNRTCWNGLYRVNRRGQFNVPKGTKSSVVLPTDNFRWVSDRLQSADVLACDFEATIGRAGQGDLIYADPPYTVQHNDNGFLKYNEHIFSWADQIRLRDCLVAARERGARVIVSNAAHHSLLELYEGTGTIHKLCRSSVLAASSSNRRAVDEIMVVM